MDFEFDTLVQDAWRYTEQYFDPVKSYPYHNRSHTENVFQRTMTLCAAEQIDRKTREEIAMAAIFHDTGYTHSYTSNEPIGAEFAHIFLLNQQWAKSRINQVESLILATALGSKTPTLAHAIIQDSDLDILGRVDGVASTFWLYEEIARFSDIQDSWIEWLEKSTLLFHKHQFHTQTAKSERGQQQQDNARVLAFILDRERKISRHE